MNTSATAVREQIEADGSIAIDLDVISDEQIESAAIEPAHLEVSEDLTGEGLTTDRLEMIERFLAVDYLLTSGMDELRTLDSESQGDGSSYSYADVPSYRDKAKRLDRSGKLDSLDKPSPRVSTPDSRGEQRGQWGR